MSTGPNGSNGGSEPKVVLIAESQENFRRELSAVLSCQGVTIKQASTAQEVLDIVRASRIDLVCSDLDLSGATDGNGLASWLRANWPGVQILLTSSNRSPANRAISFIQMPFSEEEFIERVKSLLSGSR